MKHSRHARLYSVIAAWGLAQLSVEGAEPAARTVDRLQTEARGFYLLWSQGKADEDQILSLPFVRGGQVVLQWADVEPAPGRYDFAKVDAGLARFAARRQRATLQINGNVKPAWLFAQVPAVAEKLSVQVRDAAGTLMFWHPRYQAAHLGMLAALARHLEASPHRAALLGLRLNFNAIGTEHLHVPPPLVAPDGWKAPAGVDRAAAGAFDAAAHEAYVDRVVAAYDRGFADWTTVFVRNNLPEELRTRYADKFARGRLAWFHTSSEAEPRSTGTERQYATFQDYCRSGQTVAYAEPWASAWGEHGGGPDPRWCSPAQWCYWTMLLNLHCGVSFIGEYHTNLRFAVSGEHGRDAPVAPASVGPREFMAAYTWGADYVGRHNRPAESPGAWVAFRENAVVKAANPRTAEAARRLARFTGDYTWLAERVGADGSTGEGPVGPATQRYGAFARRYAAGTVARIRLDPEFRRTLQGNVVVRVIAMGAGAADIQAGPARLKFQPQPDQWSIAEFSLPARDLPGADAAAAVEIRAEGGELLLHLIEVRRAESPAPR
jgi:hypothetical protein